MNNITNSSNSGKSDLPGSPGNKKNNNNATNKDKKGLNRTVSVNKNRKNKIKDSKAQVSVEKKSTSLRKVSKESSGKIWKKLSAVVKKNSDSKNNSDHLASELGCVAAGKGMSKDEIIEDMTRHADKWALIIAKDLSSNQFSESLSGVKNIPVEQLKKEIELNPEKWATAISGIHCVNPKIVLGVITILVAFGIAGGLAYFFTRKDHATFEVISDIVEPELGETEAEEHAIFKKLMEPYKDLSEEQKEKAFLVTIQDRLRENTSYGSDIESEGVENYVSSPEEILADGGDNIDCEDSAILSQFWFMTAKSEGMLPEESNGYIIHLNTPDGENSHAIFVYESGDIPPERYVVDSYTTGNQVGSGLVTMDQNRDGLVSYDEYMAATNYEVTHGQSFSYDPNNPGQWSYTDDVNTDDWLSESGPSFHGTPTTIGDSITGKELVQKTTGVFESREFI